jgi:CRISPR-associated protein Cmr1
MKLRTPKVQSPVPTEAKRVDSFCKTFTVKLITPLYGGGVAAGHPDPDMPIRAAAIRGQLRFWWRVLNQGKSFVEEQAIWGGMGNEVKASRVLLAVKNMPTPAETESITVKDWKQRNGGIWNNGAGYALGIQNDLTASSVLVSRNAKTQPEFYLEVRISPPHKTGKPEKDIWQYDVLPALRWWASFGGLGARTRRGLGSVHAVPLPPYENEPFDPVDKAEAERHGCKLHSLNTRSGDAVTVWAMALNKLRNFRQGANVGRNPNNGRSRWPEADSIREITGCWKGTHEPEHIGRQSFPRAVFGLPIITHFKDREEPADTTLYPLIRGNKKDRMGSPLILKAMQVSDNQYAPIALVLPYEHTNSMGLLLEGRGRNLPKRFTAKNNWYPPTAKAAMTDVTNPKNNSPIKDKTGDVLQDFLNFFEGK